MSTEKRSFQAEVSRLLDIVAHSLYSRKEVFLRELISNASDACDRLRYLVLTDPSLAGEAAGEEGYRVTIAPDRAARTLTIADNGIGMSESELIENLGTIARSGTAAFLDRLSGDERKDTALIGQFGVGFYSAFMVAGTVEVVSRRAGESAAARWASDGKGEFTVEPCAKETRGTTITLHLKPEEDEYLDPHRLRHIVKAHSDHVPLPIVLVADGKEETVNTAGALWTRPKSEITPEQYRELYQDVAHSFDEPWLTLHSRAEGAIEYTSLLFVPSSKPFDLFEPERRNRVRLYVRRVFVTDDCPELLPAWLRFLRGVVDSEDLPLNVSREMLQRNPVLARMKGQIVRRVLAEIARKAADAPAEYTAFWENFGAVLKEGIYEDSESRETLLGLARFRSTAAEGFVSLDDYVARMRPGQEAIYTINGDDIETLKRSPQLEGFRAKGVEVLLLTDPVDEFWVTPVGRWKEKPFKSVTRGGADLARITGADDAAPAETPGGNLAGLIAIFRLALGDAVKDVRQSERLTDSPVCLVADEGDLDMHLERLLKQHRRLDGTARRILEVNPRHPLVARLAASVGQEGASDRLGDFAWLLLDQARILEGEPLPDATAFSRRLSALLEKGLDIRPAA